MAPAGHRVWQRFVAGDVGTMGSLAAIPFWLLLIQLPWQLYSLTVMFSICIGVYICHRTAKDMKVHDHGSIVWGRVRRHVDHADGAAGQ